jgi:hypothetical protein
MNCDCLCKLEAKIKADYASGNLTARPKKAGELSQVTCAGAALNFASGAVVYGVVYHAYFKGQMKPLPVRITAEFCPHCGKSTKNEEPETKNSGAD